MLAVTSYAPAYIAACSRDIDARLAAFDALPDSRQKSAFAPGYFGAMVLALDHCFLHRMRGQEGKDGNPLNELRMLCDSLKEHGGVLTANPTIKYAAGKSATGIAVGEVIALDRAQFGRLADAVFETVAAKFG
jgi:hypothetical protein